LRAGISIRDGDIWLLNNSSEVELPRWCTAEICHGLGALGGLLTGFSTGGILGGLGNLAAGDSPALPGGSSGLP
jgi:hypothetical protein